MKQKFSIFLMSFMLVMQIISNGLFIPMTASATDTVVSDDATTEQLAKANEAAEAAEQAHLEKTKSFIADLFTSNEKIAIKQGIAEGQITTAKAYTEQLTELTDDETKASLQQDITLVEAFVAVNALFGDDNETIIKGLTQATIDAAQEKVNVVSEKSLSKGKAVLDEKLAAATKQLANNNKVKTKATKIANETTAATSEEKVEASVKQGTKAKAIPNNIMKSNIDITFNGTKYEVNKDNVATILEGFHPTINDELTIKYYWALDEDHGLKEGDTYVFQLPKDLKLASNRTGDMDGYATFLTNDKNEVTFTFTQKVEGTLVNNGWFEIGTKFSEDELKGSLEQEIDFGVPGLDQVPITFAPKEGKPIIGDLITKTNTFGDNQVSPTELQWKITVNEGYQEIKNAVVKDEFSIPESNKPILKQGTKIKLTYYNWGINGKYEVKVEETQTELNNISLGDITGPVTIEYTTTTIPGTTEYKNTATLSGDSKPELGEANEEITVELPEPLLKEGKADGTNINWKVYFNMDKSATEDVVLEDSWTREVVGNSGISSESQKLKDNTFKVYRSTELDSSTGKPINGEKMTEEFDTEYTNQGFKLTIKDPGEEIYYYYVTYTTEKNGAVLNNQNIINTAKFNNETKPIGIPITKETQVTKRVVFCNKKVQRIATKNTECCHPIFPLFSRQCVC